MKQTPQAFLPLKKQKWIPYLIPLLLAIFQLIQNFYNSPAYYTQIDSEYVCLLNGANIAVLDFKHIGYFVHPGTPFIILTGIFIRTIHVFAGQDSLLIDVISRPEMYLRFSSVLLMLLTTAILIWGGKKVYRKGENLVGMLIIQSSFLLSELCLYLPVRYTADRLLPVFVFIFAIFSIELFQGRMTEKKYSLLTGILLGIGLATKINFFPILIIPFFLIKKVRLIAVYLGSLIVSTFISLLPIISKLKYFKTFIISIFSHDGMYGQGKEQVINLEKLIDNTQYILHYNKSLSILLGISLGIVMLMLFKPTSLRKRNPREFYFFIAFLLSALLQIIMVSKHYKDSYLAPMLALLGLAFYLIWMFAIKEVNVKKSLLSVIFVCILIFMITPSFKTVKYTKRTIQRIEDRKESARFLAENRKPSDWLFLEPSWKSDPTIETALMWGISYVAGRAEYLNYFKEVYPRVITYEGTGKPISQFRCADANEKEIITGGDDILLVSIPGDQTPQMIEQLNSLATKYDFPLQYDTIFVNQQNKDIIIRASHTKKK